ncbi:hypothetical protein DFH09DRAFT_1459390 [Mycena vulgaris]|nr:hypothetical protein DFH09DRAFT_1459390 [Mycena vulgaris]
MHIPLNNGGEQDRQLLEHRVKHGRAMVLAADSSMRSTATTGTAPIVPRASPHLNAIHGLTPHPRTRSSGLQGPAVRVSPRALGSFITPAPPKLRAVHPASYLAPPRTHPASTAPAISRLRATWERRVRTTPRSPLSRATESCELSPASGVAREPRGAVSNAARGHHGVRCAASNAESRGAHPSSAAASALRTGDSNGKNERSGSPHISSQAPQRCIRICAPHPTALEGDSDAQSERGVAPQRCTPRLRVSDGSLHPASAALVSRAHPASRLSTALYVCAPHLRVAGLVWARGDSRRTSSRPASVALNAATPALAVHQHCSLLARLDLRRTCRVGAVPRVWAPTARHGTRVGARRLPAQLIPPRIPRYTHTSSAGGDENEGGRDAPGGDFYTGIVRSVEW